MAQKKVSPQDSPFLTTAAEAIGTALGKLAVRTGVATPPKKARQKKAAPKKRTVASKKVSVASGGQKQAKKKASR